MTPEQIIKLALTEDIGSGDHSSLSCIDKNENGEMELLVKENGILAGVEVAKRVFLEVDPTLEVNVFKKDGEAIVKGDVILNVRGSIQRMLTAERTVLNFVQRMSGIATSTHFYVNLIKEFKTKILDTRKTTPNMRYFEKYAVKIGGAENHRFGLFDMIMLKDNHIDFAGGIEQAIEKTQQYLKKNKLNLKIEIETRNLEEVQQVLQVGGVDRIMLDNFTPTQLSEALALINGRVETEASGGITHETIRDFAATGVDFISVGALTHHIRSLDLSLKFKK